MSSELGKYKPYPEYKESGVEWLDLLPSDWKTNALKFALSIPMTDGPHETPTFTDEGIPFVSAEAVSSGTINFDKIRGYISEEDNRRFSLKYKPKLHDVYMIKSGATTGVSAIVETDIKFNIWSPLAVMRVNADFSPYYLLSYLRSNTFQEQVQLNWSFGTQQNIGMGTLENIGICCPPIEEQQSIASFLDYETARIDSLIAKQQQLIELLKEKRQAVISHVVTKGLNPDVPMKDSGVEWLGQVPEHWDVKPLRYLGSCQNGINISADAFGTGYPFVSYGDVYNNRELPTKPKGLVESSISDRVSYSVKSGDVLFTRTSETIEEIGFTSVCIHEIKDACFAGFIIRFRPSKETLYPYFSKYYFSNNLLRYFFVKEMNLVTRASLSQDLLKKLTVAIPPYDEQVEIADYLNLKNQFFDIAEQSCCKQINLLKERRISLISSAVTGKIDLRNWAPPLTPSDEVA
ncbi:restriction endonuclease subunit S [Tolumonas auensis]|uniref:restriction endonuclease subunit S n=1 Tax=Tolumonas auensis TaxID=43948 RepID=UPI002AA8F44E|nr:restriction endonuclease subunit S [Tolumonas auensis]